jgi:hypothetical protein
VALRLVGSSTRLQTSGGTSTQHPPPAITFNNTSTGASKEVSSDPLLLADGPGTLQALYLAPANATLVLYFLRDLVVTQLTKDKSDRGGGAALLESILDAAPLCSGAQYAQFQTLVLRILLTHLLEREILSSPPEPGFGFRRRFLCVKCSFLLCFFF